MNQDKFNNPEYNEKPAFVQFFLDPEKPIWLRFGLPAVLIVLVCMMLFGRSSKPEQKQYSTQGSFPEGPAGLADPNAGTDQMRALTTEMTSDSSSSEKVQETKAPEQVVKEEAQPIGNESVDSNKTDEQASSAMASTVTKPTVSPGPFALVAQEIPRPLEIVQDKKANVWVAHQYGLLEFKNGSPDQGRVVLSKKTYDSEFNDELPPLTSLAVIPDDQLWLGFTNGLLMRYMRYEWKVLSKPYQGMKYYISAIARFGKETFLAGRGLYKWDPTFNRLLADPTFRGKKIDSFAVSKHGLLYLGGADGLWLYDAKEHKWAQIWRVTRKDRSIYVIHPDHEDSLLLGTRNGLVRVSYTGVVTERLLPNERITAITSDPSGKIWVGTLKGLKLWDGKEWYSAGSKEGLGEFITSLYIDNNNRLWCGLDRIGVRTASVPAASKWMRKHRDQSAPVGKPEIYSDACEAVRGALKDATISGDIAVESIDGRAFVFLKGKLVCPKGKGYRRVDGTVVLIRGWNITRYLDAKRSEIPIPKEVSVDQAEIVLLDSKNRLWLGTSGAGAYVLTEGKWRNFASAQQLSNNPISAMLEDKQSNIWIGSTPPYDEENKRYRYPNLHYFNDQTWYHFDPSHGLAHYSTYALLALKNETMVVGTNGGLSIINKEAMVTNFTKEQGMSTPFAYALSQDRGGRIWIAHQFFGDGVTIFDGKAFYRITSKSGLFDDRIEMIAHDRSQRVWLLASNGRVGVYPRADLYKRLKKIPVDQKHVKSKNMFQ